MRFVGQLISTAKMGASAVALRAIGVTGASALRLIILLLLLTLWECLMNFESEKHHYDQHGFVIVRQLLGSQDFAELNENLDRYIREVVPTLPDGDAFYQDRARPETLKQMQRMGVDPYFREYVHHPKWKALAEAMIGEPASADQPEWFKQTTRHSSCHSTSPRPLLLLFSARKRPDHVDGPSIRSTQRMAACATSMVHILVVFETTPSHRS